MDDSFVRIGTVSQLTLFPLKSARGVQLQEALCSPTGLKTKDGDFSDRHWIVRNTKTDRFVTGRQEGKLTTIRTTLNGDQLELDAKGMPTLRLPNSMSLNAKNVHNVKVWGDDIAGVDCGQEATDWICSFLGCDDYGLLFCAAGVDCRKLSSTPDEWRHPVKSTDQVAYQDACPFMVLSEASLADVNGRLPDQVSKVSMDQFRPNIVVSGCESYEEDNWKNVYIGSVRFTNIKLCDRCILTTVNPANGKRHPEMEPLKTLRSYRLLVPAFGQAPCFGTNLIVDEPGVIKVGDPIMANKEPSPL